MEVILFAYAAISFALLIVHLVDYFGERSPLSLPGRTRPTPTEPRAATPPPAEEFDRAA
jgi:hypothetical protein